MYAKVATKNDIYKYEIGIIPCFCICKTGIIPCFHISKSGIIPCFCTHKTGIIPCNVLGERIN